MMIVLLVALHLAIDRGLVRGHKGADASALHIVAFAYDSLFFFTYLFLRMMHDRNAGAKISRRLRMGAWIVLLVFAGPAIVYAIILIWRP